jgi:hypothetical protein
VVTLNEVKPKLIVASCPHCMNSIGREYKQIGGDYQVMHHTEYLEMLVGQGRLASSPSEATITYHDPCYLGRHNGVYDAPRNLLHILGNEMVELGRTRENAFCCGAGGAQFWKEEEVGDERISDNRFREAQLTLEPAKGEKVLAVGCPFCKSMLGSTPLKGESDVVIKDVAELLLEGVRRKKGAAGLVTVSEASASSGVVTGPLVVAEVGKVAPVEVVSAELPRVVAPVSTAPVERKKWQPKGSAPVVSPQEVLGASSPVSVVSETAVPVVERKRWQPKGGASPAASAELSTGQGAPTDSVADAGQDSTTPVRKKWQPKKSE